MLRVARGDDGIKPTCVTPELKALDLSETIRFHTDERPDGNQPALSGQLRFDVQGVTPLHRRLAGEVPILWGPEVYHYGRREFSIRDPNGYALVFSEPA